MNQINDTYSAGGARAFYAGQHFADAADRVRAARRAARPLDAAVANAIEGQNRRYVASPARTRNLALLRDGAAAAVTGQQVGLFLGPLYNVYKAASAIRVAAELQAESGAPVVPVFWLQCEDHDLPEIACCRLPCANGETLCLQLPSSREDRVSLAHVPLPDEVDDLLGRLGAEVENLAHGATYLARLRRHYRAGAGWTEAFAGLLAELFAPYGLIVVNPRCSELAGIAAGVHRTAIERAGSIAAALQARGRQLEDAGFTPTVHVREGAPLSFFHPDGAAGARYRLQPSPDGWSEVGGDGEHSNAELLQALQSEPLSFSTSVLLRPILQDTLLPTAAYVGGGGEVAYFAQLEPLYDAYGLTMPLVVPRAGFRLVEAKTQRLLERIGADATCAARPEHDLVAAAAPRVTAVADRLREQLLADFGDSLDRLRRSLENAGPGMAKAIAKTRASVEHAVDRLIGKYETAVLHERRDLVEAVREIKRLLFPEGMPQERFYGWPYFAARYGENELVARLVDAVVPFDPAVRDLRLEDAA